LTKRDLRFERIKVKKIPGFNLSGLSVSELNPRLNIIYGPNAVGKTTLSKAFRYLLWPEAPGAEGAIIEGNFKFGDSTWYLEIDGGSLICQQDGSPASRPFHLPVEEMNRYYIALHDLLQEDTRDQSLAEVIIRESAGGYDLTKAAETLGYKDRPSIKGQTSRIASEKIIQFQQATSKQRELENEEDKLEGLYKELEEIQEARRQLDNVRQVIEYKKAREEYEDVRKEYEGFPEEMSGLTGDEEKRLKKLKEDIKDYRDKILQAEQKKNRAEEILDRVVLPDGGIKGKFFTEIKNKREKLNNLESEIQQLEGSIEEAKTQVAEKKKLLVQSLPEEELEEIDTVAYNELNDFARRAEDVHNQVEAYSNLKRLLNLEEEPPGEEGIILKGIRFLEDWLRAPEENVNGQKRLRKVTLISVTVITFLTLFMTVFINPWFLLLLLFAGGISWYGFFNRGTMVDYREIARKEFEQLEIEPPEKWEQPAVKKRLMELYELEARIKLFNSRKEFWRKWEEDYRNLSQKQEEINQQRERLIERFGVAPDTDERKLLYLTNHISRWQEARHNLSKLESKLSYQQTVYSELLDNINQLLGNYGYQPGSDSAEISGNIIDLEERNTAYQQAFRDRDEAEDTLEITGKKLKESEAEKETIFTNLNLEVDDEPRLRELCLRYPEYLQKKKELEQKEVISSREKEKLDELVDFDKSLLEKTLGDLQAIKLSYEQKAGQSDQVYKEISQIETRIKDAKEDNSVEKALAERERALDELERELDRDYQKLAGQVLVDFIREVHTVENRPAVLRKAREFFAAITRGSYELEVSSSDTPSFRAIDTATGRGKSLDELSSGTRIQLLLAVRMAFIDQEENELALPLYLDETLANSDEQRARAIIESVIELSRRGRQCFYFTARMDEVEKWLSLLEGESDLEAKVINLGKSRDIDQSGFSFDGDLVPSLEEVPSIEGLSHKEYRESLKVPGFNPRNGAGETHLWYLIEDLELLECFLRMGISKWGQLKTLLQIGRVNFIPEEKGEVLEEVEILGQCLEEFIESWKVGRGNPVDRTALQESGAVSDNFIDEVTELSKKLGGDAELLLEELRKGTVANFRSSKIDQLEQYFKEENYIDSLELLSEEELYLRMISVLPGDSGAQLGQKVQKLLERLQV
jgi:DNA repair exonuclease SbcCD ATPase subunit